MEIKMKYYLYLTIPVLILCLYLSGCAELETDIAQPQISGDFHKEGILDPMSPHWHGDLIREAGWDMNDCRQCHGGNYNGGLVEVSCLPCHSEKAGPENCSTCHGNDESPAPPQDIDGNTLSNKVGAHRIHLAGGNLGKSISCSDCHKVPAALYDEGHVDSGLPAEVPMNGFLATLVTNDPSVSEVYFQGLPVFRPDPEYDYTNMTCANTYCHGYFKSGNSDNKPEWSDPAAAACGTCHGDPSKLTIHEKSLPKTVSQGGAHPNVPVETPCSNCHGGTVDENYKIINPSKHIDGKLNLFGNDLRF